VTAPGSSITDRDILKYCSDKIEKIKMPKQLEVVADLPKTPNGKVDKKILKDRVMN
jgi:acyl-coenzyme A synthetase/AMP-(fatty) acid ligase